MGRDWNKMNYFKPTPCRPYTKLLIHILAFIKMMKPSNLLIYTLSKYYIFMCNVKVLKYSQSF